MVKASFDCPRMMRRGAAPGLLAALVLGGLLSATDAPAAVAPPAAPAPVNIGVPLVGGRASIGGLLSCSPGSWSGNPVAFSYEWLRDGAPIAGQHGSTYAVQAADRGATISCRVTAATEGGEYTIEGLAGGLYSVRFAPPFETNYLIQYFDEKPDFREASAVRVGAGAVTAGVDAQMAAGGEISGRVTAAGSGFPVAGARVDAVSSSENAGAETDANGEYSFVGLPSGEYVISFEPPFGSPYMPRYYDEKPSEAQAERVSVLAGSTHSGIDASLPALEGGGIDGYVRAAGTKAPIKEAVVLVSPSQGGEPRVAETNEHGEWGIENLASGEYTVQFSAPSGNYATQFYKDANTAEEATPVRVVAPASTPIDVELEEGAELTGQVIAQTGKQGLEDVEVDVSNGRGGDFDAAVLTTADGRYAVPGLPKGSFTIAYEPPFGTNFLPGYFEENGSNLLKVQVKNRYFILGELASGGEIAGVVKTARGAPAAMVDVYASNSQGGGAGLTNTAGEYVIPGLATGAYKVLFEPTHEAGNLLPQYFDGSLSEGGASAVPVVQGTTTPSIDATLGVGGEISGRVTSAASGAVLGGIGVDARPLNEKEDFLGYGGFATTDAGTGAASALSDAVLISASGAPNSSFETERAPVYNAKAGVLEFFFTVLEAGAFHWSLGFRNSDVAFADSLAGAAGAGDGRCKKGLIRHRGRCVHLEVPFATGVSAVGAGTVELKVKPDAKALKALRHGHTLHVSGTFTFLSARGGVAVAHSVSATVKPPRRKPRRAHG